MVGKSAPLPGGPYRLVCISWLDASGGVMSGWRSLADIRKKAKPEPAKSVGWLIVDTDDVVTVCPHLAGETEPDGDGEITIPRSWVTRIVDLAERKRARRG